MLIHAAITADRRPRAMLLINNVASEPHPPPTIHGVDAVTVLLQTVLSSISAGDGVVVSAMPTLRVEDASAVEVTAPGTGSAAAPEDAGEAAVERPETEEATWRAEPEETTRRVEPAAGAAAGAVPATGVEEATEASAVDVTQLPPAR
jgi:hypothetical protein